MNSYQTINYDTMNETIVHCHVACLVNIDWSGHAQRPPPTLARNEKREYDVVCLTWLEALT